MGVPKGQPIAEAVPLKKPKNWTALTVMLDVEARLDKVRKSLEKKLNMRLSWTKFFSTILPEIERDHK